MSIEVLYLRKNLYPPPPKQISGYAPGLEVICFSGISAYLLLMAEHNVSVNVIVCLKRERSQTAR